MKLLLKGLFLAAFVWQQVLSVLYACFDLPLVRIFRLKRVTDVLLALLASIIRLGAGVFVARGVLTKRPTKPLILYEYEGCPFCRRVRETLSELDLDAVVYPCPRETMKAYGFCDESRFRPTVREQGGKLAFPFLVDENTGVSMYESKDIQAYLWKTYGKGGTPYGPIARLPSALNTVSLMLASLIRPLNYMGSLRTPSRQPEQPLRLYSFEGSPYCRLVREALSSLEIPFHLVNLAKGSAKRAAFQVRTGKMMVPYLEDPNTGFASFESQRLIEYLYRTYATGPTTDDSLISYVLGSTVPSKPKVQ